MAVATQSRPIAGRAFTSDRRRKRIVWPRLAFAAGLTAAQFAILFVAWQGLSQDFESSPGVTVVNLPPQAVEPPPVEPSPQNLPEQIAGGSTRAPAPAPPVRRAVATPPMVLTELTVAPAPPALAMPTLLLSEGVTELDGLGEGAGEGAGTGTGTGLGSGGGGGAAPPARRLTITWAPDMRFDRLHRRYPAPARADGVAGFARLDCEVLRRGRVRDCQLLGEVPAGHGFGDAALRSQPIYRIHVRDHNGDRVYGERIILNAHFSMSR